MAQSDPDRAVVNYWKVFIYLSGGSAKQFSKALSK